MYVTDKAGNIGPTVGTLLHVSPWIAVILFAVILLVYLIFTKTTKRPESKLKWWIIALLLLPVAMFGFWSSYISGRKYGLGITGGWISIFQSFTTGIHLNWEGAEVLGVILGGLIAALINKEFKFRLPKKGITYLQTLGGGALLGFGAIIGGGCNSGHFFTGIPQLALSSIMAGIFFILGNWFMAWIIYERRS